MLHHLLVGWDAELGKHSPLMRDVIDHVRVVVGIDRADPLVHARALPRALRAQRDMVERVFEIVHDGARLVHRESGVLEDRYAVEGMQGEVRWFSHFRLEVPESVGDILMSKQQPHDLNKGAAWKSNYDRIGHRFVLFSERFGLFVSLTAAAALI